MKLRRKVAYGILTLLLAACVWPAFSVRWAQNTAEAHGCKFGMPMHTEGCWVEGENIATQLNAAYANAGFLLLTLPVGFVIVLTLLIMVTQDMRRKHATTVGEA